MSKLRTYLASTNTRQKDLARSLGVSVGYMSELVNGDKTPGLDLAVRIEDATGGQVPARSWVPELPPSQQDVA